MRNVPDDSEKLCFVCVLLGVLAFFDKLVGFYSVFLCISLFEMDLAKMPNERKLQLCKYYFYGGFALLPFLWAVNAIWFAQQAFCVPPYEEQKQIKKYVMLSGVLALISLSIYVAWIIVFQTNRAAWGEFADSISFVIPAGVP